jgi:hypothetical protein
MSKIEASHKPGGQIRKKLGVKSGNHKPNKSVVERVEDEEMDKILTELKYFKDHIQASKGHHNTSKKSANKEGQATGKKNKEANNESGDNTTAPSQQASRPRTSRGNRPSSKVARRTAGSNEGGGHSAMGFHSNKPNHHLLYNNIDNPKHLHNRSLNEVIDSPRTKKRKLIKGRMSPNMLVGNHQRHPSALMNQSNQKGKMNLENAKMELLAKSRPQSAKLKKKAVKGDRSKKGSAQRQRLQEENDAVIKFTNQPIPSYFKNSENSHNLIENHMFKNDGNSFDRDDVYRSKLIKKNLGVAKKSENKIYVGINPKIIPTKKVNSKFMMYKRPDGSNKGFKKSTAYEQISYAEANPMHNTSIDSALFRKGSYQIDKKRKGKVMNNPMAAKSTKQKHKRSATPSIPGPQQYLANHLHHID